MDAPPTPWTPGQPFDPAASAQDIRACFRLLLGRDPSAEEWPGHSGFAGNDLRAVVRSYLDSREFAQLNLITRAPARDVALTQADGFVIHTAPDDLAVGKHVAAGVYEPELAALFRERLRPGMGVVDIGANIGFFTMLAASLVGANGSVLAIEPNLANVRMIEASRRANGFGHVTIAACGLAATTGILALHTSFSNGMTGPLAGGLDDLMAATIVPCLPLSALLPADRPIDFIKIDVEGAEHIALSAAYDQLARWRPLIASEFSPDLLDGNSGVSGADYLAFFAGLGYRATVIDGRPDDPSGTMADVLDAYDRSGLKHIDILLTPTAPARKRGWRRLVGA